MSMFIHNTNINSISDQTWENRSYLHVNLDLILRLKNVNSFLPLTSIAAKISSIFHKEFNKPYNSE